MVKKLGVFFLAAGLFLLCLPETSSSQTLELMYRGFGGIAGGTTDNSDKTGSLGPSMGGGLLLSFYPLDLGGVQIGLCSGFEYTYLAYEYKQPVDEDLEVDWGPPIGVRTYDVSDLTAYAMYNYVTIPITLKIKARLSQVVSLTAEAGFYVSLFAGGSSENDWEDDISDDPFGMGEIVLLEDGVEPLDDSNTPDQDYGLRGAIAVDFEIWEDVIFSPGIIFDFGLQDITEDVDLIPDARDTFWKAVGSLSVIYRMF